MSTRSEKHLIRFSQQLLLWGIAAVGVVMLHPAPAFAQEVETSSAGKGSTKPFTLSCRDDEVLIGIKGSAGSFVDNIQGICVQVQGGGDGPKWRGNQQTTGSVGGTGILGVGLTAYDLRCPANQAVNGISGRAGDYVDQLKIHCAPLASGGRLAGGSTVVSGKAGGNGGNPFGPLTCPDSKPAKALKGNSGSFVDKISLACNTPLIFDPGVKAVSLSPNKIVSGGSANGVVTLEGRAANTTTVSLSSRNLTVATVQPSTVTINRGEERATFSVNTSSGLGCATIEASANGVRNGWNDLLVQAPASRGSDLTLSLPDVVFAPQQVTGTIKLNLRDLALPAAGEVEIPVALSSSNPAITFSASPVLIKVGGLKGNEAEARFTFNAAVVGCVVITATIIPESQKPMKIGNAITARRVIAIYSPGG